MVTGSGKLCRDVSGSPRRRHRLMPWVAVVTAMVTALGGTFLAQRSDAVTPVGPGVVRGDVLVHDPSMVRGPNGTYVLVSTAPKLAIRTSTDRTTFTYRGVVFPAGASWTDPYTRTSNGNLWAPDISYHDGSFYLYYAASSFGSNVSAIFLATSPTGLPGTWKHRGMVYSTTASSDHNAIDPNLHVGSNGRWWLTLGSFWTGLKQIELDPSTGLRKGRSLSSVAARPGSKAVESPAVIKHGSYYYLFMSWDSCCRGSSSTYRIMVGRGKGIDGPFYDRDGIALLKGGGTQLLATRGRYVGPGGQSIMSDVDGDLLTYHYYDAGDGGKAKLGVNLLGWDGSGWPYLR